MSSIDIIAYNYLKKHGQNFSYKFFLMVNKLF